MAEQLAFEEVSVIAAQLIATKGRSARRLLPWIARATSSLPVPLSPVIKTVESLVPLARFDDRAPSSPDCRR